MLDLNYEKYFNNEENKYYDSKVIITILEDILDKSIDVIKKDIIESKITVTQEQIQEFLQKKFEEENPELKRRIENKNTKRSKNIVEWTEQDTKDFSQELADNIHSSRYYFSPYSLEYFDKYTTIVRNKIKLLLNIIEKIGTKNTLSIKEILIDLDIKLDENGNISKEDIVRLITPTVYNIQEFNGKIADANDLNTYLTFKMSKHTLYKDGFLESEIYPKQSIQIKDLYYNHIQGNVRLSENQIKELNEEREKSAEKLVKI